MNLRYSVILLLLVSGCAAKVDKFDYLKQWDSKWQTCNQARKNSTEKFPESVWFNNLNREDKKNVLLYVDRLKQYECAKVEADNLRNALSDEDITTLNDLLKGFVYFEPPSKEEVSHLDQNQLDALAQKARLFSPMNAAVQLDLID